jgi:hypothetical protein
MKESGQRLHFGARSKLQIIKMRVLKSLLIICFLSFASKAAAPGLSVLFISATEPIDAYERLINAVVMVESAGDTLAINELEEAFGAFQIRPVRLLDYYQRTGKKYTIQDCFNFDISKEIFLYYAMKIGYPDYQSIARKWNGSGRMTRDYWEKVKLYL